MGKKPSSHSGDHTEREQRVVRMGVRLPRLVCSIVSLSIAASACGGIGREPVPDALAKYLEALQGARYEDAYELTQLGDIGRFFGRGSAVSLEHFEAFFAASPLKDYEVSKVFRLDRRDANTPREPGTPFFVVDVVLHFAHGRQEASFDVEGEVLGRVTVSPDQIALEVPSPITSVTIDGVQTDLERARFSGKAATYQLLVLSGRHVIRAGDRTVTVDSAPAAVIEGSARLVPGSTPRFVLAG